MNNKLRLLKHIEFLMEISPRKKKKTTKVEFDSRVDSEYTTENAKKNFDENDDDSQYKLSE